MERVRCQSSIPSLYYKNISEGSVNSDKDCKDQTPVSRKNIDPKELEKELKQTQPVGSKENKKDYNNPNEDFSLKVNFKPSRLTKKSNPNDSNVDGNTAIRKYK